MKYPIANIKIGPRQREADQLGDIEELAESMARLGQLHNIGLLPDGTLVYGRRRLAAATHLGWTEIEARVQEGLTPEMAYEIELEEDVRRLTRTWQSEVIAVSKLFYYKSRQAREKGVQFGHREMASYIGFGKSTVTDYISEIAVALEATPRDEEVWAASGTWEALEILRGRVEKRAYAEIQRRQAAAKTALARSQPVNVGGFALPSIGTTVEVPAIPASPGPLPAPTARLLTLRERVDSYNQSFRHLGPPNTPMFYVNNEQREFIHGFWFVGGGNISDFYGAYQVEYLKRITTLFPDIKGKQEVVHLFSGSIPLSPDYTVAGLPDNGNQPDVICDAHELSSRLGFSPRLIFADPPYSVEDSEHYANAMVDRARVLSECAVVLKPGGFVVWIDQALPIFSADELQLVGAIGYIRSTGNRFRMVTIFRKPIK